MSSWRPLLCDGLAEDAAVAVYAIAKDLKVPDPSPLHGHARHYPFSLAFGRTGVGVFYAYLGRSESDGAHLSIAGDCMEQSLAALSDLVMPADLFRGFAGIGWAYEHLRSFLWSSAEEDDPCQELDDALVLWCYHDHVPSELMYGLGGVLVYALERRDTASTRTLISALVDGLAKRAVPFREGRAWPLDETSVERVLDWLRDDAPREFAGLFSEMTRLRSGNGIFRPGVAHGVAGTLASLAGCGAHDSRARSLAVQALSWLLAQTLPAGSSSVFPEVCGTRLAIQQDGWCTGDLGIACCLLMASRTLGLQRGIELALAMAKLEAAKRIDDIYRFDRQNPILCHGRAGRAHLFNRLYQATGEENFAQAAHYWFEKTLELRRPGEAGGGFTYDDSKERVPVEGLLMGSAGIGLALLAATTSIEPAWDCILGLSIPRSGIPV